MIRLSWMRAGLAALLVASLLFVAWKLLAPPAPLRPSAHQEVVPPGIIVTETSSSAPPAHSAVGRAPGDSMLADYANPALPPQNDLSLIAHSISSFLIVAKQATDRPLSANEEWSAALRGKRPGFEPWISERSPALNQQGRLIDRWGTPLFFHALGGKRWEIRSAGPDRRLWTGDDLIENTTG
ncbi:MAG: hypothetical protein ABI600_08985 [Luteolibacter sp.]